jgi:hypothetical protein
MQVTLLLPDRRRVDAAQTIASWLIHGDRVADAAAGPDTLLRDCFQFIGTALPAAALTRSLDAKDAAIDQWLRADPAFVLADAVTLRLLACGKMDLSTKEVDELAAALKPLFGDSGFLLEATHPERWYLRCARAAKLPTFSSPDEALGDDLAQHLPHGEDARRWRSLLNEVQMTLHDHPVNSARVRRGLPPVNSVWVWGGGVLPDWVRSAFSAVYSDDEVVVALARLAGTAKIGNVVQALSPGSPLLDEPSWRTRQGSTHRFPKDSAANETSLPTTRLSAGEQILVDLRRERDLAALEQHCFTPIQTLLARRKIRRLNLSFESGERMLIKPWQRWRFWRRAQQTRA